MNFELLALILYFVTMLSIGIIFFLKSKSATEKELPDKDQLILVYCRSGRRSKIAAEDLVKLGYTNVKEFGGIIDWEYEIVK